MSGVPRLLALVVNNAAGGHVAGRDLAALMRTRLPQNVALLEAPAEGTLPARIAAAVESGADTVAVAGGDGTIACACQAMAGTDRTLAILPMGTMNLLARDLRLPVNDIDAAIDALAAATPRAIDLGRVGDHVFACACMLGLPARIGHHREIARHRRSALAWLGVARAAWRAARRARHWRGTLTVDGQTIRLRTRALTIVVNPLDDASGRAFGRTVLDGGTLCVYVERVRAPWDIARLALRIALGSTRDPALPRLQGKSVTVDSGDKALRILIDGEEHLLPPPLHFSVWQGALRVLAPDPAP